LQPRRLISSQSCADGTVVQAAWSYAERTSVCCQSGPALTHKPCNPKEKPCVLSHVPHLHVTHGSAVDQVSLDAAVRLCATSWPDSSTRRGDSSERRRLDACVLGDNTRHRSATGRQQWHTLAVEFPLK
jgi:hypothetical protein